MPIGWRFAIAGVVLFTAASLVSYPQSPAMRRPLLEGAQIPADALAVIQRACKDCHSEQTEYPWYSYIAPISFWIRHDVSAGRLHLNFSAWPEYSTVLRERRLSEIANQIQDRDMPLTIYMLVHPAARLSDHDRELVFHWTQNERARLIGGQSSVETRE